jgi:hypothetical protein
MRRQQLKRKKQKKNKKKKNKNWLLKIHYKMQVPLHLKLKWNQHKLLKSKKSLQSKTLKMQINLLKNQSQLYKKFQNPKKMMRFHSKQLFLEKKLQLIKERKRITQTVTVTLYLDGVMKMN